MGLLHGTLTAAAVRPCWFTSVLSAKFCSSISATGKWPAAAAQWSGVWVVVGVAAFTSCAPGWLA